MSFAIVVPTIGRPSLGDLLCSLAASDGPRPEAIVLVDDRPDPNSAALESFLPAGWPAELVQVRHSRGRGPAAARNAGWRAAASEWIVFLDDDVQVTPDWLRDLDADLAGAGPDVAAIEARLTVPMPAGRRPTDWERNTAGLQTAKWITADMAYRRSVLRELAGFDERFQRAFREDADLALRAVAAGHRIAEGRRRTLHPVRPAPWWVSVATQRGNADDALMRALHGVDWHRRADAPVGRLTRHLTATAGGAAALVGAAAGRGVVARMAAATWMLLTAEFAYARIVPGPRDGREVARMLATSVAIPPVATWHWLRGLRRHRHAPPWPVGRPARVSAVVFDRDGTLVQDVPYNGDPARVEPMPGVRRALDRLRAAGVPLAVITNQSGVGRGELTLSQVAAVNARVDELLGPFDVWQVCPHRPQDRCVCRKPEPGMVLAAARELGVDVTECVVVGDIGADVAAAEAAGATGVLIPTDATLPEEVQAAATVFDRLDEAIEVLLAGREVPA